MVSALLGARLSSECCLVLTLQEGAPTSVSRSVKTLVSTTSPPTGPWLKTWPLCRVASLLEIHWGLTMSKWGSFRIGFGVPSCHSWWWNPGGIRIWEEKQKVWGSGPGSTLQELGCHFPDSSMRGLLSCVSRSPPLAPLPHTMGSFLPRQ